RMRRSDTSHALPPSCVSPPAIAPQPRSPCPGAPGAVPRDRPRALPGRIHRQPLSGRALRGDRHPLAQGDVAQPPVPPEGWHPPHRGHRHGGPRHRTDGGDGRAAGRHGHRVRTARPRASRSGHQPVGAAGAATSPVSTRPPIRLGLRAGLVIAFLVPAVAIWIAASWFTHARTRSLLDAQVGEGLVAVAAAAASQISAERVLAIQPGDDVAGLRSWTHLAEQLETLRTEAGLRRAVVVDLQGRVRVDTGSVEAGHPPVLPLPVGVRVAELSQDLAELAEVREGRPTASLVTFRGLDGSDYRRGYAPLRGPDGTVVGVLAVEGSTRTFAALRRHALEATLWGLLVTFTLGLTALLVAAALGRPFRRLRDAARRIGAGNLSTPVTAEPRLAE